MPELWGHLTCQEVLKAAPSGTLSLKLQKWADLGPAIHLLPNNVKDHISLAAAAKGNMALKCKQQSQQSPVHIPTTSNHLHSQASHVKARSSPVPPPGPCSSLVSVKVPVIPILYPLCQRYS
ncbi:hypothetical protein F5J12DRAFT_786354 [Pisolithus orientalis]|uniref:uncharacterized protein n=1 Tax=Pisolithus orientalis TaxID=936130 RepID=UPI0022250B31|nr:uncharacterized protein F5J12DRAFT_786354 [Pisolithus orientalis]KAI5991276.1 hypothetical protein F5J12DRAFT_786354 [Pisolithus orientalis]